MVLIITFYLLINSDTGVIMAYGCGLPISYGQTQTLDF